MGVILVAWTSAVLSGLTAAAVMLWVSSRPKVAQPLEVAELLERADRIEQGPDGDEDLSALWRLIKERQGRR